jgi:prepilin-type N-terminal cleavage/methylation domain-containing protein
MRKEERLREGFSLMEVLVSIAIIGMLVLVVTVGISPVREGARAAQCLSNLRQIGMAVNQWSGENGNLIPATGDYTQPSWMKLVAPYLGLNGTEARADVFRCPGDPSRSPTQPRTYRYNLQKGFYTTASFNTPLTSSRRSRFDIKSPASYVMLFDVAYVGPTALGLWSNDTCNWLRIYDITNFPPTSPENYPRPHYKNKGLNLLYYDGHTARADYPLPDAAYFYDYER